MAKKNKIQKLKKQTNSPKKSPTKKIETKSKKSKLNKKKSKISKLNQKSPKTKKQLKKSPKKLDKEESDEFMVDDLDDYEYYVPGLYDYYEIQNDLENLPHDKFTKYDVPETIEQNQAYLKKLLTQSDVILELLDSRDIFYFLSENIRNILINNLNKLHIYVLTKVDLVSENYIKKMIAKLSKETNNKIPIFTTSSLNREKIQILYEKLKAEINQFKTGLKSPKKKGNDLVKIGIVGRPNVGKNSLIQSFELINNSNCDDKFISFEDNNVFCVNSVPACTYGKEGDNYLTSSICKKVEDIKEPLSLIRSLFQYCENRKIKEIYELKNTPEDIYQLIEMLKEKFSIKNEKTIIQQILKDIIKGKIYYEKTY